MCVYIYIYIYIYTPYTSSVKYLMLRDVDESMLQFQANNYHLSNTNVTCPLRLLDVDGIGHNFHGVATI